MQIIIWLILSLSEYEEELAQATSHLACVIIIIVHYYCYVYIMRM